MKLTIYIFNLAIFLVSCDSFNKRYREELIKQLDKHDQIKYLETNLDILKVNKTYYCDLIETEIECLNSEQIKSDFNCTKDELDDIFDLVRKSGALAVEKNENGQVLFANGFMNEFNGLIYSPMEIDLNKRENYFVNFFISRIEKESDNWYRVE